MSVAPKELEEALRLFDETTKALESRARRLEEVLTVKQAELQAANLALEQKVTELDSVYAYMNLVLDSVASGVVAVSVDGTITACNPAARFLLQPGAQLADPDAALIGQSYRDVMRESAVWDVLERGEAVGPWEKSCPGYDGQDRCLAGRSNPIFAADGTLIGAVETFEDVTEIRRLEDQLERNERLKALGEMAAGVAHEIRNPLNGIEGFASLLGRDLDADSKGARYANAIVDGVRHLNATVSGLLEFTSPKPPDKRPVPIVELCRSCIELVDSEVAHSRRGEEPVEQRDVPITLIDNYGDARVPCDGNHIRQVLLNILQNACQILRQHDCETPQVIVEISAIDNGQACQVTIDDNGPGVPTAERQRIFTPFHSKREQGTGLGLAVAHTLIGLHGGTLQVAESPLAGARFLITLPLSENI